MMSNFGTRHRRNVSILLSLRRNRERCHRGSQQNTSNYYKYRRKVFYNEKKEAIREIIRTLCQWKGVEIIEGEVCPDHIHLLLSIPPKMSVSGFMGYLKGKSSLMIFQRFGNMKFAYRNREFWCKGYYVDTVGKNTAAIKSYIANQLKQDKEMDQISLFDPRDPFTGSK